MTTSREEIAKLVVWVRDLESQARRMAECDGDLADNASVRAFNAVADALLSQQRSLDRVAALCDEAATIMTGRTEMQMWGVVEVRRLVGVLGNIRAALEAQPSPEPGTARKGKTP